MRIIICGSISASEEIIRIKKELENIGHMVEIPLGIKDEYLQGRTEVSGREKADDKIKNNLIRNYFEKIKKYEVVLVVNPKKNETEGYIGGNTLIEMAFAHVLGKKLYCLYPVSHLSYSPEILAMKPVILNGNLREITDSHI